MTDATFTAYEVSPLRFRASRRWSRDLVATLLFTSSILAGGALLYRNQASRDATIAWQPVIKPGAHKAVHMAAAPVAAELSYGALLDPALLGRSPILLADNAPLASEFRYSEAPVVEAAADAVLPEAPVAPPVVQQEQAREVPLPPVAEADVDVAAGVPLPTPRPPELEDRPDQPPSHLFAPRPFAPRMTRMARAAPAAPATDNRSVFEKLFGIGQPSRQSPAGPMLAYATPDTGSLFGGFQRSSSVAVEPGDRYTAVYDISSHTVTLPDGTRLEAHSGLGNRLDDPRFVHERMRGPTPPHVYDLSLRAQLFHGVRALRLTPVGGGSVYGRNGLLAHTFMLGPNGDSNGCVSFRNYDSFLQAFQSGQVRRLTVVAGRA